MIFDCGGDADADAEGSGTMDENTCLIRKFIHLTVECMASSFGPRTAACGYEDSTCGHVGREGEFDR